MTKPMSYKGYASCIEYSDEDGCFVGRVAGIKDILTFHGSSVEELRGEFKKTVNFYLESCQKSGESPDKPYSGKLMLRVPPEIHAAVATAAEVSGKSINQWVSEKLSQAAKL